MRTSKGQLDSEHAQVINKGYIRHSVLGDGDCAYTSFGITREQAYAFLSDHIDRVGCIIQVAVKSALLTEEFFTYLQKHDAIADDITHDKVVEYIDGYCKDLSIINAYLTYDLKEGRMDAGYAHPSVIQALGDIQNIRLRIWCLDHQGALVPHQLYSEDYATYAPPDGFIETIDLLFVNNNHFERIEMEGYQEGEEPDVPVHPLQPYSNNESHSDIEVPTISQSAHTFMDTEVKVNDNGSSQPVRYKKILLIGEADFSFSSAYLRKHIEDNSGLGSNIVATAYETEAHLRGQYGTSFEVNTSYLREQGVTLLFGIDAMQIHQHPDFQNEKFDAIHFNFPHDGSSYKTGRLKKLLGQFFDSATKLQNENGKIYMGLPKVPIPVPINPDTERPFASNYFYKVCSYDIYENTLAAGYRLMTVRHFGDERYPGYAHVETRYAKGASVVKKFPREYVFVKTSFSREEIIRFDMCRAHQPKPYKNQKSGQMIRFQLPELTTEVGSSETSIDVQQLRVAFPITSLESANAWSKKLMCLYQELNNQYERGLPLLQDTIDELIFIFTSLEVWYQSSSEKNIYTHPDGIAWKSHVAQWYYSGVCFPLAQSEIKAPEQSQPLWKLLTVARLSLRNKWIPHSIKETILGSLFYLLPHANDQVIELALLVLGEGNTHWRLKVVAASTLMRLKNNKEFSKQFIIPTLIRNIKFDPRLDWLLCSFLSKFSDDILSFVRDKAYHDFFKKIDDFRLIYKLLYKATIPLDTLLDFSYPSIYFYTIAKFRHRIMHNIPLSPDDNLHDEVYIRKDQLSLNFRRNYFTGEILVDHLSIIGDIFLPGISVSAGLSHTNLHNFIPYESFFQMGCQYLHGMHGCEIDLREATRYIRNAAIGGHPGALSILTQLVIDKQVDILESDVVFLLNNLEDDDSIAAKSVRGLILMFQNKSDLALQCFRDVLEVDAMNQTALFYYEILNIDDLQTMKVKLMGSKDPLVESIVKLLGDFDEHEDSLISWLATDNVTSYGQNNFLYMLLGFIFSKCHCENLSKYCFEKVVVNSADHELAIQWLKFLNAEVGQINNEKRLAYYFNCKFRLSQSLDMYNELKNKLMRKVSKYQCYLVWIEETNTLMYLSSAFREQRVDDDESLWTCAQLRAAMLNCDQEAIYDYASLLRDSVTKAFHGTERIRSVHSPYYEIEYYNAIHTVGVSNHLNQQQVTSEEFDNDDDKDFAQQQPSGSSSSSGGLFDRKRGQSELKTDSEDEPLRESLPTKMARHS